MRLIDADALKKEVGELWLDMDDVDFGELVRDFWKVLNHFPTVNAEPVRHGRWVTYPECLAYDGAYRDTHMVCSECEHVWDIMDNDAETFGYCPHCGAKMDGGENDGKA